MVVERIPSTTIEIAQGQDWTVEYRILAPETVQLAADAADGATTLSILPLQRDLSNGDKLLFGDGARIVTLGAAASAGDVTLTVSAINGPLYRTDKGQKIRDITGWTIEWELLKEAGDATPEIATGDVTINITSGTEGVVQVTVPDEDTEDLEVDRAYVATLWRKDDGSERPLAYSTVYLRARGHQ